MASDGGEVRPKTGEMLAALDRVLGGRAVVLACLAELAEESGVACVPVSRLWEEHGRPAVEPKAAPQDADPSSSGEALPAAPEVAAPEEPGQHGLFGAADLHPVKAPDGPVQSVYVHFENWEDITAFAKLIGQPVTSQTKVIQYPAIEYDRHVAAPPAEEDTDGKYSDFRGCE